MSLQGSRCFCDLADRGFQSIIQLEVAMETLSLSHTATHTEIIFNETLCSFHSRIVSWPDKD